MWSLKSFFGWADNGHDKTVWRLFFAIMTHFMALKIKGQHHQFYASVRLQLLWSTTAYVRTVPLEVDVWNPKNCHECSRGGRESTSSLLNGELWCFAFFLFEPKTLFPCVLPCKHLQKNSENIWKQGRLIKTQSVQTLISHCIFALYCYLFRLFGGRYLLHVDRHLRLHFESRMWWIEKTIISNVWLHQCHWIAHP